MMGFFQTLVRHCSHELREVTSYYHQTCSNISNHKLITSEFTFDIFFFLTHLLGVVGTGRINTDLTCMLLSVKCSKYIFSPTSEEIYTFYFL